MTERAALTVFVALFAGVGAHFALHRASRRLASALAARRGAPVAPGAPARRAIALGVILLQAVVWLGATWLATQQFDSIRMFRGEAAMRVAGSLAVPLVTLGERSYSTLDLLVLPLLVVGVWLAASGLTRLLGTWVLEAAGLELGARETLSTLLRYGLSLLGTIVVLQAWGVDVRSLAILGGVLGVGIGFGLQNIANNFVSGLLIGFERPVRPGDFVRVGEYEGTVQRVGARSTRIRTPDRVTILVPNSRLLEREVVNFSLEDPISRVHVPVRVARGVDVQRVRHALLDVARAQRGVLREPRPEVLLAGIGESAFDFELLVWTADPRTRSRLVSDLYCRIASELARRAGDDTPHAADALAELAPEEWSDEDLRAVAEKLRGPAGVPVQDRRHLLTTYRRCFVGSEAVDWLASYAGLTRGEAVAIGQRLVDQGRIRHVLGEHGFRDGHYFFRFREDEGP
jgi:small-conductance mechanosensitive channel